MASVLKSRQLVEGINTVQAEVFNWEDVAGRAKQYLETVREQAHKLIADARQDAERIRNQAAETGVADGQQQMESQANQIAQRVARDQVSQAMKTIDSLSQQLEQATQQWLRQWQHETIPLAIAIAEKLVSRQVDAEPEILMQWIEETIHLSHGARSLRLRMHPASVALLQPALGEWIVEHSRSQAIELIEDSKIEGAGIVLETSDGKIDMQLKSQLERLSTELS